MTFKEYIETLIVQRGLRYLMLSTILAAACTPELEQVVRICEQGCDAMHQRLSNVRKYNRGGLLGPGYVCECELDDIEITNK